MDLVYIFKKQKAFMQCSGFLIFLKGMPLLPLRSSCNLFSPDMLDYNSFGKTSCATCVNEQQRIRHMDRLGNGFRLRAILDTLELCIQVNGLGKDWLDFVGYAGSNFASKTAEIRTVLPQIRKNFNQCCKNVMLILMKSPIIKLFLLVASGSRSQCRN